MNASVGVLGRAAHLEAVRQPHALQAGCGVLGVCVGEYVLLQRHVCQRLAGGGLC